MREADRGTDLRGEPVARAAFGVSARRPAAFVVGLFVLVIALGACVGTDSAADIEAAIEPAVIATTLPPATAVAAPTSPSPGPTVTAAQAEPTPTIVPTVMPIEPIVYDDNFATSIAPIFATKCASCHNTDGPGAAHWRLETAADLVATHELLTGVVASAYMPPWPASDLSLVFHENRSLSADQIQAITDWSAAGAPIDVTGDSPIASPTGTVGLDADIELAPHEPFQGSTAVVDDLRCMIYDLDLNEQQWLQGVEFVPDQTQIVHHAIAFVAPADSRETAQQLSDEDDLGGWPCGSFTGLVGDEMFFTWAPGQHATIFPEGTGMRLDPGDFLVVQIHYHFDTEAPADASMIKLDWAAEDGNDLDPITFTQYLGPAEIPCAADEAGPLCDRDAALAKAEELYGAQEVPADFINAQCGVDPEDFVHMTNGEASSSCERRVFDGGEIVAVFGHLHELGTSIRLTLNAGLDDEQILLDIPDWSFDWQFNYYPADPIMLTPGDRVLLECSWDRNRRSPELEPAYVLWAEGTNDEMCFASISTRPAPDS